MVLSVPLTPSRRWSRPPLPPARDAGLLMVCVPPPRRPADGLALSPPSLVSSGAALERGAGRCWGRLGAQSARRGPLRPGDPPRSPWTAGREAPRVVGAAMPTPGEAVRARGGEGGVRAAGYRGRARPDRPLFAARRPRAGASAGSGEPTGGAASPRMPRAQPSGRATAGPTGGPRGRPGTWLGRLSRPRRLHPIGPGSRCVPGVAAGLPELCGWFQHRRSGSPGEDRFGVRGRPRGRRCPPGASRALGARRASPEPRTRPSCCQAVWPEAARRSGARG